MLNLVLCGASGRMGRQVMQAASEQDDLKIVATLDRDKAETTDVPQFAGAGALLEAGIDYDVLLDFSHPSALPMVLELSRSKPRPLVVATTGYSEAQTRELQTLAGDLALLVDANMSRGVHLLTRLVREAAAGLWPDYDIEIVEQHHRRKKDAPSGTALKLAAAAQSGMNVTADIVTDRSARHNARPEAEIGISSVRGGNISGIHDVIFAGQQETLTLSHEALSPVVFALGALDACRWIKDRPAGSYTVDDLL